MNGKLLIILPRYLVAKIVLATSVRASNGTTTDWAPHFNAAAIITAPKKDVNNPVIHRYEDKMDFLLSASVIVVFKALTLLCAFFWTT